MSLTGLRSSVGRIVSLLEAPEEKPFSCLLQLLEASCVPWLMAPSPHLQSSNIPLRPPHAVLSRVLFHLPLPYLRSLMIILGPSGKLRSFPHLKVSWLAALITYVILIPLCYVTARSHRSRRCQWFRHRFLRGWGEQYSANHSLAWEFSSFMV